MSKLTYVQGDATKPTRALEGSTIYGPHCCNNSGGWGSGYVNAITARWGAAPRGCYKMWHEGSNSQQINDRLAERAQSDPSQVQTRLLTQTRFVLGGSQLIQLPDNYVLVNMIGQHGYGQGQSRQPIRYGALAKAMSGLTEIITNAQSPCEIHCPKFGSDLAGGNWKVIEAMILELWVDNGIPVTAYEWVK